MANVQTTVATAAFRPLHRCTVLAQWHYRREGADRQRVMTVSADEFMRRFLLHILPRGFHRIRHYGLLAASCRKASLERIRALLAVAPSPEVTSSTVRLDSMAPPAPHS